jgi:hypothetical protein
MRADRLKQVMQQIDSSFDEKNLGMSKFSRFVTEAAQKGLLTLTKLENGQFEVGPPRTGGALPQGQGAVEPAAARPPQGRAEEGEATDRPRRSRRGGRGRDREGRGPRPTSANAPARVDTETSAAPEAQQAPAAAQSNGDAIGSSGLRLTREDAFNLVRRAVGESGPARASQVRSTARELLGRDSESLSERNFLRILQDAHDADLIDLRRRGSDYEVAPAVAAAPVSQQLAATEPPKSVAPAAPSMPTGMGARSAPQTRGRGRGPIGARAGELPAHLLSIGVVEHTRPTPEPVAPIASSAVPSIGEDAISESEEQPRSARKRGGSEAKPRRPRKSATSAESGEKASPRRSARKSRSKSASSE